ncbi:dehydrogenase, partial [Acidobacteria bacterium AH-259-A15]|nr:dehydrogenase [Acidobacteria bacterium AH-259-A15]
MRWIPLLLATVVLSGCSGCPRRRGPGPLSPQEALETFQINQDFRLELFAAEPYVSDPVELIFDEQGRAFVAEMLDYPYDPEVGEPPRSRIRLIEDTDGDGQIDRSTIFADKLLHATSILPWKGGLIVTSAPDIVYLKDTDGDNKADVREVLFTGFATKVDPESRITNLRFNIDNWIYASNNGRPGNITFSGRPDAAPVFVLGADFRFRLDRGLFEAASGPTQFGQAIDDWGHRFITQNTVHVRHVVMPRRYLSRNLFLAVGGASQDVSDHGQPSVLIFPLTPPQYWRQVRTEMRQQRYREHGLDQVRELNPSTEIASGYFTAAAGGTIYGGDTFPVKYRGNLFTGDVSANLVHRDVLHPSGVSFTASRAEGELKREFLASTDPRFRPCNFTTGPDGNLYLVDMYREFVETPASIVEELKKEMDF